MVDVPFFGARGKAKELLVENQELREQLERTGALSLLEVEKRKSELESEIERTAEEFATARARGKEDLERLQKEVVKTEETAILQEVGVYEYRHPLDNSVAYQGQLKVLRDQIKSMTRKDGGAVHGNTNWTVNNSAAQGRKMVRDFSKLMLRAYNAEADTLIRGMKPYKLDRAIERLTRVSTTITKLGATMDIRISQSYHRIRVRELEYTADYLEKVAEEKEREREEKARLREEQKAQKEMERERARLEKERKHYENALAALRAKGDDEAVERLRAEMAEIDKAIEDVDYRVANIRAGYVYVISNVGSFGDQVVKIGMTRRIDPTDRVRELSDASVPFKFDTHALFFAEDAVAIESELHRRLADTRINLVNMRREFFRATPADVKAHLLEVAGDILEYEEVPEALEWHQSLNQSQVEALPE